MSWKIGNKVLPDSDGAHSWTTSSVRDGESLVKVEMAYVCSEVAWRSEADLSVHVGAVHVDLSSIFMDDVDHFSDSVLVLSSSRRESDHEGSEVLLMLLSFSDQIFHVYTAVCSLNGNNFHAGKHCACWVRSVSGFRNEADVSMPLSGALQVFHNCEKASVLPSGPRVWLEADFVEFSD